MDTIKLNITRKKSRHGALLPYIVYFNDLEIAKIPNGRHISLDVPADKKFLLTISLHKLNNSNLSKLGALSQKLIPHSALSYKKVMIYPEYCKNGVVDCIITTHGNLIGTVSFGYLRPTSEFNVSVDYN